MKNIKSLLFSIIYICLVTCSYAQEAQPQQITFESFKKFKLNNPISLNQLIEVEGDWSIITNSLGNPESLGCKEYPEFLGFETSCDFMYPGLEINYTNVGQGVELAEVVLLNNQPFIQYGSHKLQVGHYINSIENIFPEAYQNRWVIESNDGVEKHVATLRVNESGTYITIEYEKETGRIVTISLTQILT